MDANEAVKTPKSGYILMCPSRITAETAERVSKAWERAMSGPHPRPPLILEAGWKVVTIGDAPLIEVVYKGA